MQKMLRVYKLRNADRSTLKWNISKKLNTYEGWNWKLSVFFLQENQVTSLLRLENLLHASVKLRWMYIVDRFAIWYEHRYETSCVRYVPESWLEQSVKWFVDNVAFTRLSAMNSPLIRNVYGARINNAVLHIMLTCFDFC